MRQHKILIAVALIIYLATACSLPVSLKNTPTAVTNLPAATATEDQSVYLPIVENTGDPVWGRVRATGRLIVGTSADYPPFEFYDVNYQIIGFDASLARELGAILGLHVELVDIPFEGLPASLQLGQIDIAIAAISVTPERQAVMDFSNVYYTGQDEILARQNSSIPNLVSPAQLAQYRVGVQRGSIYASWVQSTLVDTGMMPGSNLLQYEKAIDAVRDLRENRADLVIMDQAAAEVHKFAGGLASVGGNMNRQVFAIAMRKGASELQSQMNQALSALQKNGTMARLIQTYLLVQAPPAPSLPLPTATPVVGPTATPIPCYDSMGFVQDIQVPDGTQIQPGQNFGKIWRIRNMGTCPWDSSYRLDFVQGDWMNGRSAFITGVVNPGTMYDIAVTLQAPTPPGTYTSIWQMVNGKGVPFGERLMVRIFVPGFVPPTQRPPTATPVPPVQPTLAAGPVIDYLIVNSDTIQQGNIVLVNWAYLGQNVVSARLTRTNPDGSQTPLNSGMDVVQQGQYEDLLNFQGTYSYTLTVSNEFGGTSVRTVIVNVIPPSPSSNIQNEQWNLASFINPIQPSVPLTPIGSARLMVQFGSDGTITGSTGCNPFQAAYQSPVGTFLKITNIVVTGRMICADDIMGQEALLLDLLQNVDQYEIIGNELILRGKNPDPEQNNVLDLMRLNR